MKRLLYPSLLLLFACQSAPIKEYRGWEAYGGSSEMIRYSSLTEIDTNNVAALSPVWEYSSGDADTVNHSQIQCNPIMRNGVLYGVSPQMKLFALDAVTGKPKWVFDPNDTSRTKGALFLNNIIINSRGIAYWSDGKGDERIFFTGGSNTYAINALTGRPISSFGDSGFIDLHKGLGRPVDHLFVVNASPGIVYKDLLIMGSKVEESPPAAPGHIRAYDVRTGKMKWIFHTIPQPGEYGYETWEDPSNYKIIGGANVWSGFALDEQRGILFAPTGSATYDFYGGKRKGANLFANCLIALDANTGKRKWHYQFIHHDVWDRDLPTPPALITISHKGKTIDAVAQPTKNGMLFLFDRETGQPLYEIKEIPVDTASELPNEKLWPTQPVTTVPEPFVRQTLTAADINPYQPDSIIAQLKKQMAGFRYGNMFLPPGKKPSLVFPGYDGGAEWGGPSFDPQTGIMYINANEMAWILQMLEVKPEIPKKETNLQAGKRLYNTYCSPCHGGDRKGTGNYPSILNITAKYTHESFLEHITKGRRMMPGFSYLSDAEKLAISSFVMEEKKYQQAPYTGPVSDQSTDPDFMPYRMNGYTKFLTPDGKPAISPPWGTLNAIDLKAGKLLWKIPLGEYADLKAKGIPATGTENYGGPVVTKGGLVFIAATRDSKIRAFNKYSGKLLWEYELPAPGFATPAVYEWNGKQYLVIACGGGKLGTQSGDKYVCFALPDKKS